MFITPKDASTVGQAPDEASVRHFAFLALSSVRLPGTNVHWVEDMEPFFTPEKVFDCKAERIFTHAKQRGSWLKDLAL